MNTFTPNVVTSFAHSKIILVGEHAVVYGLPAIAVPFPLGVKATVKKKIGMMMLAFNDYMGPLMGAPIQMQGIVACIKATLNYLKKPLGGLLIQLHSSIPIGKGLGASASIAVAVVRSLFVFFGYNATEKEILPLVQISEVYAHGNPSGIDMAAVSSDLPIWYKVEQQGVSLHFGGALNMVVADTGKRSDTLKAVSSVREMYLSEPDKTEKIMIRIERIVQVAKTALADGNMYLLGRLLNLNHAELMNLDVSNVYLDKLVFVARNAGALGAKMTGGGQGGCMFALAKSPEQAKSIAIELTKAGAFKTWCYTIGQN